MVQTESKFLDDLARLATGAAGTLHGVRQEIEGIVRQRLERVLTDLDLVTREEFDAVKAMAVRAREENEALSARLAALEAAKPKAPARKKPSARKANTGKAAAGKPASSKPASGA